MSSIYSFKIIQKIIDHWGIGKLKHVSYFNDVGPKIWRHSIETLHGSFSLYSYLTEYDDNAQQKIAAFIGNRVSKLKKYEQVCHSFDRYHLLYQSTQKNQINRNQVSKDFEILKGIAVEQAYRVYGSIIQIDFVDGSSINTYAQWSLQEIQKGVSRVLVSSYKEREKIDTQIAYFESKKPIFKDFIIKGHSVEFFFTEDLSLHFKQQDEFSAVQIIPKHKKYWIDIVSENEISYERECTP